jgi:hypothetical protein
MGNEIRAINEPKFRIETNSNDDRWQHPLEQSRYVKYVSTYVIVHCELMNGNYRKSIFAKMQPNAIDNKQYNHM